MRCKSALRGTIICIVACLALAKIVYADGLFLNQVEVTEDGVPIRFIEPIGRGMAYDPVERHLWTIADGLVTAISIDSRRVVKSFLFPWFPELGLGLAFDPVNRHLFVLQANRILEEYDLDFKLLNCFEIPFLARHSAGLTYDPVLDAFWASGTNDAPSLPKILYLIDRTGAVLDQMDITDLIAPHHIAGALAFDIESDSIWLESSRRLFNITRTGELIASVPVAHSTFLVGSTNSDVGLAWDPDDFMESHIVARSGSIRVPTADIFPPFSVLRVNGQIGNERREVAVPIGTNITISVDRPPRSPDGLFALFAIAGEADANDLSRCRRGLCHPATIPIPFTDQDTSRTITVINETGRPLIGEGLFSSGPAPTMLAIKGINQRRTVTMQALFDSRELSNAVVLHIE